MAGQVYQERLGRDIGKQPRFEPQLRTLHSTLTAMGEASPYRLSDEDYSSMRRQCGSAYGWGQAGRGVDPPNSGYIYRITNIGRLGSEPGWRSAVAPNEVFNQLMIQCETPESWAPLWPLVGPTLEGCEPENFTWWTRLEPNARSLVDSAYRLGIVSEWIASRSVILRCDVVKCEEMHSARWLRIPCGMDGYHSPIFDAEDIRWGPVRESGYTIDIRDTHAFRQGPEEYAAFSIPTECITVLPCSPGPRADEKRLLEQDSVLWDRLLEYYS